MYCDKCGAPIPNGQDRCPNCQGEETKIEFAPEAPVEPAGFQLNMPQDEPVKKSGGKKTALLAVGAAVIVALIGAVIVLVSGAFRSPQQQLLSAQKADAKSVSAAVSQAYGTYVDALGNSFSPEKGFGMQADYRLSLKEELWTQILSTAFEADMSTVDLSWIEHLLIHVDMACKDSQMDMGLGIGLNDQVVLSVKALMDTAEGKAVFGFPELNSAYLSAKMEPTGANPNMIQDVMSLAATLAAELPDEDAVEKMLNRYLDILLSDAGTVEKSTETISVGDLSKSVTVLKQTLTQEQLAGICKEILTTAKSDETFKQYFKAMNNYYTGLATLTAESVGAEASFTLDIYQQFLDGVDDALAELEAGKDSYDRANFVVLSNYLDKNEIIGRKLEIFSEGSEPEAMHYLTLTSKAGRRLEVVIDDVTILGKGEGDTMEYTLTVDGEEMLTLQTQELKYTSESISGTIRLYPSKALLKDAFGLGDSFAAMADLAGCYGELQINSNLEHANLKLSIVAGGEALGSLEIDGTVSKEAQITMPETVLDPSSEADMDAWTKSLNFDKLISNLEDAKVPSVYVSAVRQLVSMLSSQLSQAA